MGYEKNMKKDTDDSSPFIEDNISKKETIFLTIIVWTVIPFFAGMITLKEKIKEKIRQLNERGGIKRV